MTKFNARKGEQLRVTTLDYETVGTVIDVKRGGAFAVRWIGKRGNEVVSHFDYKGWNKLLLGCDVERIA